MNKVIVTFLLLIGIVASSCTTSKSVISQKADLSRYEYASIINNDTYHIPAQLMEYEIQLFDAIESSRLKLVNDIRIGELSPNQQSKLGFSVSADIRGAIKRVAKQIAETFPK